MSKRSSSTSNSNTRAVCVILAKLIAVFAAYLAIFFGVVAPQYINGYNASIIDKISRLESIDEPKIVLVGNSNVAFGIRSDLIEDALGMPVVNLGLHAGLGNSFHDSMTQFNVRPGDIVVFLPYTFDDSSFNPVLAWTTIENHFDLWKVVPQKYYWDMLKAFPTYEKRALELYLDGTGNADGGNTAYSRGAFNEYGDNVYARDHDQQFEFEEDYTSTLSEIDDAYVDELNSLAEKLNSDGVLCVVASSPIAYDGETDVAVFDGYDKELRSKLGLDFISDSKDYLFSLQDYYDGDPHLREYAAVRRTEQLIEDLREYLDLRRSEG